MRANEPQLVDKGHDLRVAQLCVEIGRELGFDKPKLKVLGRAGLLHDVGKLAIPTEILEKEAPLTESEWQVMRTHPELGLVILGGSGRFTREMLAVLYHHERMDGSGYPHGLIGIEIPIEARIVAVADTYDVLTSDRPYRHALNQVEALGRIFEEAGHHLDPYVVDALVRTVVTSPTYSYVA
jgi:HD-GYP domain-containing protein (c-di-GMP phosphodiesterase class II)